MKWTADQQKIIDFDQKNDLLVSAAAGSGKTAVMTERIRHRAMSGKVEIADILVMTFTDYAAQNMREKIEQRFRNALQDNIDKGGSPEERELLNNQLLQLRQARISTIHSFCWQVLQTYSSELVNSSNEPVFESGFGVLEETRKQILLDQAVDEVLNIFYNLSSDFEQAKLSKEILEKKVSNLIPTHEDMIKPFNFIGSEINLGQWIANFQQVCDIFSDRTSDSSLRQELIKQLNNVRSLADYDIWLQDQLEILRIKSENFAACKEYNLFLNMLDENLQLAEKGLDMLKNCAFYEKLMSPKNKAKEDLNFRPLLQNQIEYLKKIRSILDDSFGDKWNRIYLNASKIEDVVLLSRRGEDKKEFVEIYNSFLVPVLFMLTGKPDLSKAWEALIEKPVYIFAADIEMIEQDIKTMLPVIARFFELVILIDRAYLRLKIDEQAVDFSDFEHFALRLLRIEEIRDYYREQIKEIYLDEYQDTNNIQEAIIKEISDKNVFMVGDIKQSIYRFRHANPTLFSQKTELFFSDPKSGSLILLNQNFRSVPGILEGINQIFTAFLTKESGEIEYSQGHALTPSRDKKEDAPAINLIMVNAYEKGKSNFTDQALEEDGGEKEALAIVRQIKDIIKEGKYTYKDIAVLGRTHVICSSCYQQLKLFNVPVTATGEREFLDSPELRLLEALVQILDNMQQDIPLATIMRSGLTGEFFSENELITIKNHKINMLKKNDSTRPNKYFFAAVEEYRQTGMDDNLKIKVNSFLNTINRWREYEQFMSVSELLGHIYAESAYIERVSKLPMADSRIEDLERFREWADSFERSRQKGLFSFAAYIRKIKENSLKNIGFDQVKSTDNAVKIMTIHGSKGLEFPVVFLAGTAQGINRNNNTNLLMASEHGGISSLSADPLHNEKHLTAIHYWHELDSQRADRSESYRLLYVGMTRAEDRLYLTGRVKISPETGSKTKFQMLNLAEEMKSFSNFLPVSLLRSVSSWLDIILMSLIYSENMDIKHWFEKNNETSNLKEWSGRYVKVSCIDLDFLRDELYPTMSILADNYSDGENSFSEKYETKNSEADLFSLIEIDSQPDLIDSWEKRLFSEYKYRRFAELPGKITVSELKRMQDQIEQQDENLKDHAQEGQNAFANDSNQISEINLTLKKSILSEKKDKRLKGSALGTLLHSLFQFIDLVKLGEKPRIIDVEQQIKEMSMQRKINPEHLSQALEWSDALLKYAQSELAADLRKADQSFGKRVYREMPFTMAVKAEALEKAQSLTGSESYAAFLQSSLYDSKEDSGFEGNDLTLIQGMIDCWFETDNGVILIDYKSDYLSCEQDLFNRELTNRYSLQLKSYAAAIEKATGKKVFKKIIWLIRYAKAEIID